MCSEMPGGMMCGMAQVLLRVTSCHRNTPISLAEAEIYAIRHYLACPVCRQTGLAEIVGVRLSCQEALLVWARYPGALYLDIHPNAADGPAAIDKILAVEHVWGRRTFPDGLDELPDCGERACSALRMHWLGTPMSSSAGDGERGVIHEIPLIFQQFLREGWPLAPLFEIQSLRMAALLEDLAKGRVTVSPGHYHFPLELAAEVHANLEALQVALLGEARS